MQTETPDYQTATRAFIVAKTALCKQHIDAGTNVQLMTLPLTDDVFEGILFLRKTASRLAEEAVLKTFPEIKWEVTTKPPTEAVHILILQVYTSPALFQARASLGETSLRLTFGITGWEIEAEIDYAGIRTFQGDSVEELRTNFLKEVLNLIGGEHQCVREAQAALDNTVALYEAFRPADA